MHNFLMVLPAIILGYALGVVTCWVVWGKHLKIYVNETNYLREILAKNQWLA